MTYGIRRAGPVRGAAVVALSVFAGTAGVAGLAVSTPAALYAEDSLVGKTLPAFSFSEVPAGDKAPGTFDSKAAASKWLVLDFLLQTDCPLCARRVGEYNDSQAKIQTDDKTRLILIKPDDAAVTQNWMTKNKVEGLPVYRDGEAALATALGIPKGYQFHGQDVHFPATLIVSPEGKVVWANVGTSNSSRAKVADVIAALDGFRGKAGGTPANGAGTTGTKGGTDMAATGVLGFTVKDIDGKDVELKKYQGKVFLMVNVASKCGLTPQYDQLQAVYKKYNAQGFEILGFPANNFGKQEPGTEADIKEFCSSKYAVTFPMFTKMSVKGADISPLYDWLVNKQPNEKLRGEIAWNFNKFLVNKKGEVIARFEPKTKPDAPEVVKAVEAALAEK